MYSRITLTHCASGYLRVPVPLPANVDKDFVPWELIDVEGNRGVQLSRFSKFQEMRDFEDSGAEVVITTPNQLEDRLEWKVAQKALDRYMALNKRSDIDEDLRDSGMKYYVDVCPVHIEYLIGSSAADFALSRCRARTGQHRGCYTSLAHRLQILWAGPCPFRLVGSFI